MTKKRFLFICNDYVGENMAGPGIRYWELAHELSNKGHQSVILSRHIQKGFTSNQLVYLGNISILNLIKWIKWADFIIQVGRPYPMLITAILKKKAIFDQYDPVIFEILECKAYKLSERIKKNILIHLWKIRQRLILRVGYKFLVANEKQRDLLIGQLSLLGYTKKLHNIIILPFGLPSKPPIKSNSFLRGTKIRETDFLIVWGGGIWDWFDPFTLLIAISKIKSQRDDIKVYFPGIAPPSPDTKNSLLINKFLNKAKELDLLNSYVFVNTEWTPYEQRANYLLEADVGISLHYDTIETRFAFRTRILDYVWAGLPIISSKGDSWAEIIELKGLGLTVPSVDVDSVVEAIIKMADDTKFRNLCRNQIKMIAEEYKWSRLTERLL